MIINYLGSRAAAYQYYLVATLMFWACMILMDPNQRHHMMDEVGVIMGTVSNLKRVDVQEAEVPA